MSPEVYALAAECYDTDQDAATLAFTDFLAEWLKTAGDAALEEYPQEHWSFIATIVHES